MGRVIYNRDDINTCMKVEYSNTRGHDMCVFPETPEQAIPVLDYSSVGIIESIKGSTRRLRYSEK